MVREAPSMIEAHPEVQPTFLQLRDPAMLNIQARLDILAKLSPYAKILLLGETGVGKELMARRIHELSPRHKGPFVVANCAAITETLFEREFFGHVKGAFTDAKSNEPGLFEQAHGGTLFLDEIGELPKTMQAKLLRIVEDGLVRRLGDSAVRSVDVRIVSATNRNLEEEVERGTFRMDLYHRLNTVEIYVPPLRKRPADIPILADYLLAKACRKLHWPTTPRLATETMQCLLQYAYPGNVRELSHALTSALVQCDGDEIRPEHLPMRMQPCEERKSTRIADRQHAKRALEAEQIRWALEQAAGNQTRAAALIDMPLRTFVSRLSRYGIPRPKMRNLHEHRPRNAHGPAH